MLAALEEHFGGRARWTRPQGGLFIWATLDGVDTTDLLAQSEGVAFVPGRSAYMDGRSGASSMRLNFAGVPDEDIREGIRRIGRAMGGESGLFGALMGSTPPARLGPAHRRERVLQRGLRRDGCQTPRGRTAPEAERAGHVLELHAGPGAGEDRRSAGEQRKRWRAARSSSARRRAERDGASASRCSRAGTRWSARSRCAPARACSARWDAADTR